MLDNGRVRHEMCTAHAGKNIDWESVAWELFDVLIDIAIHPVGDEMDKAITKYSGPRTRKGKDRRG